MKNSRSNPSEAVLAAVKALRIPDVLDLGVVCLLFGFKTRSGARRAVVSGDIGPFFRIGRRIFLRRESILSHVAGLEAQAKKGRQQPGRVATSAADEHGRAADLPGDGNV
ncbi:MAG: hypothetical protein IT452_05170 [Planctomycetia bacterium]|nr:hypothetical protein [Planctomycetia bacterium]